MNLTKSYRTNALGQLFPTDQPLAIVEHTIADKTLVKIFAGVIITGVTINFISKIIK